MCETEEKPSFERIAAKFDSGMKAGATGDGTNIDQREDGALLMPAS